MRGRRESFPEVSRACKIAAKHTFLRWRFSQGFRIFTRVAARLLHIGYCWHRNKVRGQRYPTYRLEALLSELRPGSSANFVFTEISEVRYPQASPTQQQRYVHLAYIHAP